MNENTNAVVFSFKDIIKNSETELTDNELQKIADIVQKHRGLTEFFNDVCDNAIELVLSERKTEVGE